ncbi:hypothetical protein HDV00_011507 [Rhizophlyctis rosea]|nr:hypothetical protein HDV00_011507 [Rhizophlyctis rosea]
MHRNDDVDRYIINDLYHTDVPLLHAPHVIAAAAIFFVIGIKEDTSEVARKQNLREWLAEVNIDIAEVWKATAYKRREYQRLTGSLKIFQITQVLLDLYQTLGEFTDAHVPQILAKLRGTYNLSPSAASTPARTEVVTTPETASNSGSAP